MYCAIDEAFNNPLQDQINKTERRFNKYYKDTDRETCLSEDTDNFFTAQGDLTGTSIKDLRANKKKKVVRFKDPPSTVIKSRSKCKVKMGHGYYINRFVKNILEADDLQTFASTHDDDMYDHIKGCKYCRNKINKKIKVHCMKKTKKQVKKEYDIDSENEEEPKSQKIKEVKILDKPLKEVMIYLLVVLTAVCIIDLVFNTRRSRDI